MEKEHVTYEAYLASIYKYGMCTLIFACILADLVYTLMKILGYYPSVSWVGLIAFDCMDMFFSILSFFLVRKSIKNGRIMEKQLKAGKLFSFIVLLIQWNFILYLIPSRVFWAMLAFFCILICFFLDIRLLVIFGASCIVSLFVAWKIVGSSIYPVSSSMTADWICCIVILCLSVIGIMAFVFFMTHLQWVYKQDDRQTHWQKKYYHRMLEQEEGMRRLRHDMKKHFYAIDALVAASEYEKLQKYTADLIVKVQEFSGLRTGNYMADSFLDAAVEELREQGEIHVELVGTFPQKMNITDMDFCIIFANAVENAKEALKQVEGERCLSLRIKNYRERLYITISNTTNGIIREVNRSTKSGKLHGYGIGNMRLVAEKYGGSVKFTQGEREFKVEICI